MNAPRALVIAEHAKGRLRAATGAAVGLAAELCGSGGGYDIAVLGSGVRPVAEAAAHWGASQVLLADDAAFEEPLADRFAEAIAGVVRARGFSFVLAASSTFSKDVLPRAAALLDAGMVGDVIGVEPGTLHFRRPMYAGNVIATVSLAGGIRVATVRSSAFAPPAAAAGSPIAEIAFDAASLPRATTFLGREERSGGRPDATEARIVVSGGRALRNSEDFERLVGGLADALGAAVGSSRALVDSGIAPNSLQIGQTGKIVAPDLYLALGISGAIQHTAGIKDAKIIAAINKDPEAPIFEIADFGLVADLYEAIPEFIAEVKGRAP